MQREQVEAFRTRFREEHARLSKRMMDADYQRRLDSMRDKWPDVNQQIPDGWRKLLELGQQRQRLNAQQITFIKPLLTIDQQQRLPQWDFEAEPPPRPWDMEDRRPDTERYRHRRQGDPDPGLPPEPRFRVPPSSDPPPPPPTNPPDDDGGG